jgi:hypothetical protein
MSWNVVNLERLSPLSSDNILHSCHHSAYPEAARCRATVFLQYFADLQWYGRVSCTDTQPLACNYWILQERPRDRKARVGIFAPACTHLYVDTNQVMATSLTRSRRRRKAGPCLRSVKNRCGSEYLGQEQRGNSGPVRAIIRLITLS